MAFKESFEYTNQRDLHQEAIDKGLVGKDVKDLPKEVAAAAKLEQDKMTRRKFLMLGVAGLAGAAFGKVFDGFQKQDEELGLVDSKEKSKSEDVNFPKGPHITLREPGEVKDIDEKDEKLDV